MERTLKHNGRALQDLDWTTKRKENITGEEQYMQRLRSKNSHVVFCGQRATTLSQLPLFPLFEHILFLKIEIYVCSWLEIRING